MNRPTRTIDLKFQGLSATIGAFLIPHADGAILVESGPASTLPALIEGITAQGFSVADITDVFLTHIHLDHAGAAGWWAKQNARLHVHSVGAPHLLNPEKLMASARRIYGEMLDALWGEFLPVPPEKLHTPEDGQEIEIGGLSVRVLDTPGHANHHLAYLINGVCYTGDVGGVRLPGVKALRLPTVPPEFNPELWRNSVQKLRREKIQAIAPTHFGLHTDVDWHLDALEENLDEIEVWMKAVLPGNPTREEARQEFARWMEERSAKAGLNPEMTHVLEVAISSQMSADGIFRYWQKSRNS